MRSQILKFRSGKPIVITTAHGLITIHRMRGNTRELRIVMPDGVKAFKDEDRGHVPIKLKLRERNDGNRNSGSEPVAELENAGNG